MGRARLASLTLAASLLTTASGCFGLTDTFHRWRAGAAPDCTCYDVGGAPDGAVPTSIILPSAGPVLAPPDGAFIPPPPSPTGPPPRIVPIPAQPMPWSGQH